MANWCSNWWFAVLFVRMYKYLKWATRAKAAGPHDRQLGEQTGWPAAKSRAKQLGSPPTIPTEQFNSIKSSFLNRKLYLSKFSAHSVNIQTSEFKSRHFLKAKQTKKKYKQAKWQDTSFDLPISAYPTQQLFPHLIQSSGCFPPSLIPVLTTASLLLYLILLNYFCQQFNFWKINSEKLQMETPQASWIRNWNLFKPTSIFSFLTTTSPY